MYHSINAREFSDAFRMAFFKHMMRRKTGGSAYDEIRTWCMMA